MKEGKRVAKRKYIYWCPSVIRNREGRCFAHVHLLVGNVLGTYADYQHMVAMVRETFPHAADDQLFCAKVYGSSEMLGYCVVTWSGYLPDGAYPGWTQIRESGPEYAW